MFAIIIEYFSLFIMSPGSFHGSDCFCLLQADKMFPTQGFFEVDLKPVVTRKCMAIK